MPPGETWGFSMADFAFRNEDGVTTDSIAKGDRSNHSQCPETRRRPGQPANTRLSFHDEPIECAAMVLKSKINKLSLDFSRAWTGLARRSLGRTMGWKAGQGRRRPNVFRQIPAKA